MAFANNKRPTAMGQAFWDAAHKMRQGGNTVAAASVRRSIGASPERYMVPHNDTAHFIPRELKARVS
jgi:hypothetical protein